VKPFIILLACFVLIGSLWAADLTLSKTIAPADYKDLSAVKLGTYTTATIDKTDQVVSIDTVKNKIDASKNLLQDCGLFDCEFKVEIEPLKSLTLDKSFITGLSTDKRITFDAPFYYDMRSVQKTRPTYADVKEEICLPAMDNKTGKNSTVCNTITTKKETGTETYYVDEQFENTAITKINKTTTIILRAHKPNMNINTDLGFSIFGQERWDAAWWNSSYANRYPINCSLVTSGTPIVVNGSSGFTHAGETQIVWTVCGGANLSLYYNNGLGQYAVANDTAQVPMEVEVGNGTSYSPTTIWRNSGAVAVYHFANNASLTDSANYANLSLTGTGCTLNTTAYIGKGVDFNGACAYSITSNSAFPSGSGASTEMFFARIKTTGTNIYWAYGGAANHNIRETMTIGNKFSYLFEPGEANLNDGLPVEKMEMYTTNYDGNYRNIFFNTTAVAAEAHGGTSTLANCGIKIGAQGTVNYCTDAPAAGWFTGTMTELRVYNSSLSNATIGQSYNNTLGLAGYGTLGASESGQSIDFISKTPNDITSTNVIGTQLKISYNVSNLSGLTLFYKVNSSISDCRIIINGTALCGFQNTTNYTNVSTVANFTLNDNDIYPATYNVNDDVTDNNAHTFFAINNANTMVAIELLNVSNQTQYNFFEIMANGTSGTMNYWYCNSTYAFNNLVATDPSCVLFNNIPATTPYNHTHTVNSKHQVIPIRMNISSGTITGSTVKVTPTSYFIIGSAGSSAISEWYVSNTTRTTARRTSSNGGNGWSTTLFTTDAHLHQFTNATVFYFFAQANLSGTVTNSTLQNDTMELDTLPPTAVSFITPVGTYLLNLNTTVVINFTASTPALGFSITNYTTRLINATNNANVSTLFNSTNTSYNWNASAYRGSFYLNTTTWQSDNQSAYSISQTFLLTDNFPPAVIVTTTNSTGGSTYYRGSILGYLLATDVENASLLYNYTWTAGGSANGTGSGTVANNSNTLINTHTGTLKGQQWILYTTVNDGTNSVTNNSATVTILNSPPSAPSLSSPSNGAVLYSFTQLNVTLAWSASTDLDGDPISYTYCTNATGCASTSSLSAVVLLNTSSIYNWNVTASDGSASASSANFTFRIDTILPPTMSSISVYPNPVIFNQSALCQATATSDANMTAYWYFYVNFALATSGSSAIPNNTLSTIGTIGAGNFSYGDTVLCQAYVHNGMSSANMSSSPVYVTGASNTIPVLPITTLVYNFFQAWGWIFFSILAMAVGYLSVRQISSAFFVASGMMIAVSFTFGGALSFIVAIIYLVAGIITRFSGQ
jgi:hypothetical protein